MTSLCPSQRNPRHVGMGNSHATPSGGSKPFILNVVADSDTATQTTVRGAKHAMTEGNLRSGRVVETIECRKRLKTGSLGVGIGSGIWQLRCSLGGVANARLRFSSCLFFPWDVDPLPSGADGSRDRAGLEAWTTDAAVRPTESEPVPALYRARERLSLLFWGILKCL